MSDLDEKKIKIGELGGVSTYIDKDTPKKPRKAPESPKNDKDIKEDN